MADEPTKPDPNEEAATPDEQPSAAADAEPPPVPDEAPVAGVASAPEAAPVEAPQAAADESDAVPVEPAPEPVAAAPAAAEEEPPAPEPVAAEPGADATPVMAEEPAAPAAVAAEPMSEEVLVDAADSNTINQSELDALAEQLGETAPPAKKRQHNTIDQAELDSLAAQLNAAEGESSTKVTTGSGVVVDDPLAAEMAAALAAEQAAAQPAAAPSAAAEPGPQVWGTQGVPVSPADATDFTAPEFVEAAVADDSSNIELLDDVSLDVKIELGRTNMYIEDVLRLGVGAVVELDKLAGDPVDIYVNERLIARGEVLVLNDNFCVRINNIHSPIPELDNE